MSDGVNEALAKAHFNETVHLSIEGSQEIVLTCELDTVNGGIQWNQIPPEQVLSRHLRTKKWMFPMLNDKTRNSLYEKAIEKACEKLIEKLKAKEEISDVTVLDIGSGSGLLGMLASRFLNESAAKNSVRVLSVEMSSSMASIARQVIASNALGKCVDVVEGHSANVAPLHPKASLCISELLENGLLGEGWIPAMRDAWDRQLSDDALIVPQRARVYAQLVEGDWLADFCSGPRDHTLQSSKTDFSLALSLDLSGEQRMMSSLIHIPMHAHKLLREKWIKPLSEPSLIMTIDVSSKGSLPPIEGQKLETMVEVNVAGAIHGVLVWWELDLWENCSYSMEPGKQQWQDHWHQCIHLNADTEKEGMVAMPGDTVILETVQSDCNLSVNARMPRSTEPSPKRIKGERTWEKASSLISPERAFQLNNRAFLNEFSGAIEAALNLRGYDGLVLDVSDFSLCACLAAKLGARNVISLESSPGHLPLTSARVAQMGNNLPIAGTQFAILQCHAESLTLSELGGNLVEFLFAEPYYQILEGWHLKEALNFFFIAKSLHSRGLVSEDAIIMPCSCSVMACAIESDNLRSAYQRCGDGPEDETVCGLDHSAVNELGGNFEEYDVSLPMWQYDYKRMTENFELACINLSPLTIECKTVQVSPKKAGRIDALMIWVKYTLGKNDNSSVSTDGRGYHQLVRMMKKPLLITTSEVAVSELKCSLLFAENGDHAVTLAVESQDGRV